MTDSKLKEHLKLSCVSSTYSLLNFCDTIQKLFALCKHWHRIKNSTLISVKTSVAITSLLKFGVSFSTHLSNLSQSAATMRKMFGCNKKNTCLRLKQHNFGFQRKFCELNKLWFIQQKFVVTKKVLLKQEKYFFACTTSKFLVFPTIHLTYYQCRMVHFLHVIRIIELQRIIFLYHYKKSSAK